MDRRDIDCKEMARGVGLLACMVAALAAEIRFIGLILGWIAN